VVDQHASWIAVNPVQGCPKACAYCYLNQRGQTAVRPEHLASPAEAAGLLTGSPFYAPSRPVALYTWTDVMALPASREHLAGMLDALTAREIPNPVILISKCHIPDDTIRAIASARLDGLTVLVYLSYSGLGNHIEPGIRHGALAANFPRLAEAGIPIVHYWRPALPESATTETMEAVLDWAARYARCTVAAGLKVEEAALDRLAGIWPELRQTDGATRAEGVYPRAFWEFIHQTWRCHPRYPVFHANSCALAYVLGRPDSFGVLGTDVCVLRSNCPVAQRSRCGEADARRRAPGPDEVRSALAQRGLAGVPYSISDERELVLGAPAATAAAAALTQDLGIRVRAARSMADDYWSSGTTGAVPLIVG
jgi:DNA repair photolyase